MENERPLFQESSLQGPDPKATRELMDYILNKFQMISHFHQSFAEMGMNFKGFDVELNFQGFLSEHPGSYRYVSNHLQTQPARKGNRTLKVLHFADRDVKKKCCVCRRRSVHSPTDSYQTLTQAGSEPQTGAKLPEFNGSFSKNLLAYKDTLCSHSVLIYFNNKLIVTCIPTSKRVFMWQMGGA